MSLEDIAEKPSGDGPVQREGLASGAGASAVSPAAGIVLVLLAATGFGLLPLLTRAAYAAGISPDVAAFYRFGLPAILFAPFLPRLLRTPRQALISIATGLFVGIGVLGYFRALNDMPVATAALIFFTFPLFAVIIGFVIFRLRPDVRSLSGAILVLIACALFVDPANVAAHPMAVLHAFMAPAAYATLILVISHVLGGMDRMALMLGLYLGTVMGSGAAVVLEGAATLIPVGLAGFVAAIGLVTVGGILPQTALTYGAPAVGPARTSILAAFELIVALASGWLLLGEPMLPVEVVSGLLILAAVTLAAIARPAHKSVTKVLQD